MKRQKIVEREEFTYDEKLEIAEKSDNRCCHCGKTVYFGFGATVEHYIPLSKGGTNRGINLVMLCKECNEDKSNNIIQPREYLEYLKEEHLDKLQGYFDSYIKSFDFVNRHNLCSCDRYKLYIAPVNYNLQKSINNRGRKKKSMEILYRHSTVYWMKRATPYDTEKLLEYYTKYLKKYNILDSEKAARINIEFWLTFGAIYYIDDKNNDIRSMMTVMVTGGNNKVHCNTGDIDNFLSVNVFGYYSNDLAMTLSYHLSRELPRHICEEHNLQQIPVKYSIAKKDPLSYDICCSGNIYEQENFIESFLILYNRDGRKDLTPVNEDKDLNDFFSKFAQINNDKLEKWFKYHNEETYEWMVRELVLPNSDDEVED